MLKMNTLKISAILLSVVSIVYLVQTPIGFGHDLGGDHTNLSHPPELYVNSWTGETHLESTNMYIVDARLDPYPEDSSGNGDKSATSWALRFYASSLYNANGGIVAVPTPPITEIQRQHVASLNAQRTTEPEQIFGVKLSLSASAGNSSCSASATPSVTDNKGLSTEYFAAGWSGNVDLKLSIPEQTVTVLVPSLGRYGPYLRPMPLTFAGKYEPDLLNIEIDVSETVLTEKVTKAIGGAVAEGAAQLTAQFTVENTIEREGLYAYPTGIDATLDVPYWIVITQGAKQFTKDADIGGNLGNIKPDHIYTTFPGETTPLSGGISY